MKVPEQPDDERARQQALGETGLLQSPVQSTSTGSGQTKPGTGLGLAITRALVEQMNGSTHYQPRDGGGSIFTIVLPEAVSEH